MKRQIVYILLFLYSLSASLFARVDEHALKVAERNAAQGFNDTIDRLAEDFVEAYLVVADPGGVLYGFSVTSSLYPMELADYTFQYPACYVLALAEILGVTICNNTNNMDDSYGGLSTYSSGMGTYTINAGV